MKQKLFAGLVSGLLVISMVGISNADNISASAAFTVQKYYINGSVNRTSIDSSWDHNGFDGHLSYTYDYDDYNWYSLIDKTFVEFNLDGLGGTVQAATLDWTMSRKGASSDTIHVDYYNADGLASVGDWDTPATLWTSSNGGETAYSIDITSVINDLFTSGREYVGFRWSIDPGDNQLGMSAEMPHIQYETAPVPLPATILLLGSGLVGLVGLRKKTS